MKDFKDLGDAVQSFGGKNLPSSEEIMALTSLQTTSIGSNDVEAKVQFCPTCTCSHQHSFFLRKFESALVLTSIKYF